MPTLNATAFLDFNHASIQEYVGKNTVGLEDETEIAMSLYYAVRDDIRYDPYTINMSIEGLRASSTLANSAGWCVPKAALLAACYRAKGIPARLGFADVRNHMTSKRLREAMQTDVFTWHGYTSVLLEGKWVKATPAFNKELCEKANLFPLEFNGKQDSVYHEFDRAGQKHMEYLVDHGEFDDLPMERIITDFEKHYGLADNSNSLTSVEASSFAEDVAMEAKIKSQSGN